MTSLPPEEVTSVRLVKGYVTEGEKYCWGNLVTYPDPELYPTVAAARRGVEAQRSGGGASCGQSPLYSRPRSQSRLAPRLLRGQEVLRASHVADNWPPSPFRSAAQVRFVAPAKPHDRSKGPASWDAVGPPYAAGAPRVLADPRPSCGPSRRAISRWKSRGHARVASRARSPPRSGRESVIS